MMYKAYKRKIKRYVKKYPEQSMLLLYNTGIFAWLKTQIYQIGSLKDKIDLPFFLENLSIDDIKSYLSSFSYSWLIVSFVITFLLRKMKKVVRKVVILTIIILGLYMAYKYWGINHWF